MPAPYYVRSHLITLMMNNIYGMNQQVCPFAHESKGKRKNLRGHPISLARCLAIMHWICKPMGRYVYMHVWTVSALLLQHRLYPLLLTIKSTIDVLGVS